MGNVLKQEEQEQIRALGRLGWSLRRIEEATGVRRETIARYLRWSGIRVRPPRGRKLGESKAASPVATDPATDPGADSKPASEVATDLERPPAARSGQSASLCEPHREWITSALEQQRNATAIWQDLVDQHGFTGRYNSVKRYVCELRGSAVLLAHPTIVTAPGEEAQVDYGDGPMVRDPVTKKYRRTRLFALTLGWSRKAVWLLVWKSSTKIWCELHAEAFRRLGGVVSVVVLDNLKEGVLEPDIYDPQLNPLYRDFLAHHGVVALPARVRHPDRKGKVERSIGYAQGTPLRGLRFESMEEAQAYLDRWSERWADTRIHGTTKRQVAAMFLEERPHLKPLALEPFRYYQHGNRTVHLDGCVEVEAAYYGAPPGWIGREVRVQWDDLRVRLIDPKTGTLLRELARKPRGWREVHPDDRPARAPAGTLQLLVRARNAGKAIGTLCEEIHRQKEEAGVRRILGVLSLVKKHGAAPVEAACECALEVGYPDYRFVKKWLERHPPVPLTLRQIDPLIRQLSEYQAFITQHSSTSTSSSPSP
jgi:transposase